MERSMDSSWVLYRRLWHYVRPYRGAFVLAMLGYVIFASGQPMMMGALKYFVDGLTNPARARLVVPALGEVDTLYLVPAALMLVALWQGRAHARRVRAPRARGIPRRGKGASAPADRVRPS